MALFGKKAQKESAEVESNDAAEGNGEVFSPEKAQKFFDRARHFHETANYPYAMQTWLNGFMHDPSDVDAFNGFVNSANAALSEGKKVSKSEIAKGLMGQGRIRKYQLALLDFVFKQDDPAVALRAAEAAGQLELKEQTSFLGRLAFARIQADPKRQKKSAYVQLMDAFERAGAFGLAVEAGSEAVRIAPEDGELSKRVQQLAAQSTISSGGYEQTGDAGGFRRNVRNLDKQTLLEAQDSLAKTEDVKARLVAEAEAAYAERPEDVPTIEKLIRALRDRGKKEDLVKAVGLCDRAHELTGQFRFRETKGEILIGSKRRQLARAQEKLKAKPDDEALRAKIVAAVEQLLVEEIEELKLQVEAYPTDLKRKFALGQRLAMRGRHDESIAFFQEAQDDPKIRLHVRKALADSFMALGDWEDAAIDMYEQALSDVFDEGSEFGLELKYGLMCALQEKAEKERELEAAQRGDKLAGEIAMKKFGYRDVKERRQRLKELIGELRG